MTNDHGISCCYELLIFVLRTAADLMREAGCGGVAQRRRWCIGPATYWGQTTPIGGTAFCGTIRASL